jgi:hypothetical protein
MAGNFWSEKPAAKKEIILSGFGGGFPRLYNYKQ